MFNRRSKNEVQPAGPSRKLSRNSSKKIIKNKHKEKPSNKSVKKLSSSKSDVKNKLRKKLASESIEEQRSSRLAERLGKKVWRLMSHQIFAVVPETPKPNEPDVKRNKLANKFTQGDTFSKKYKTKGIGNSKIWDSLQQMDTALVRGTSFTKDENASDRKRSLKLKVRRKVWNLSKKALKNNEYWNTLLAENNIDVDKINIDKVDLSLIDVDGLGIENKFLKRTVTWLLK